MKLHKVFGLSLLVLSMGFVASCGSNVESGVKEAAGMVDKSIASTPKIVISGTSKIEVGAKVQLTLALNKIAGEFAWASSDTKVATVEDGVVTGLSVGNAKITVTSLLDLNDKATFEVTVVKDIESKFSVKFVDFDGTLLYETHVAEGAKAEYKGMNPVRLNSADKIYKFLKWDKTFDAVTEDMVVKAVYSESDFGDFFFENMGYSYKFVGYSGKDEVCEIPTSFNGKFVTAVGKECLKGNVFVKKVIVPEGIDTIDQRAFAEIENLEEASIPVSAYNVGEYTFYKSKKLRQVTFAEGVKKIPSYCFNQCDAIKTFTFPSSATEIGTYAFFMSGLEEITIPESIETFGDGIFSSCKSLKTAVINSKAKDLGNATFSGCELLTSLTLNGSPEKLGDNFISSCKSLNEFVMPDSVKSVGDRFANDVPFTKFVFGKEFESLGEDAFKGSTVLDTTEVEVDGVKVPKYSTVIQFKEGDTNHVIQDGTMFGKAKKLVIYVFDKAKVPENLDFSALGVTEVGSFAYDGVATIKSLNLTGVEKLGANALSNLKNLAGELTIPASVKEMGKSCFAYDSSVTSLKIESLFGETKTIPESSFRSMSSLVTATLPDGIEKLEERAFGWCGSKFKTINLPKSVTYLGEYAFQSCGSLVITYEGTKAEFEANVTLGGTYAIPSATLKKMVFKAEESAS